MITDCGNRVTQCASFAYRRPHFRINHMDDGRCGITTGTRPGHVVAARSCAGDSWFSRRFALALARSSLSRPSGILRRCLPAASAGSPNNVSHTRRTPANPAKADAIIVLTGGQSRLDAALDLLRSGKGERLLISGVHPSGQPRPAAGRDRRRQALCSTAASTSTAPRSTRSAMPRKAPNGSTSHAYGSVILVTNNYHMPRSLLEMGRLLARRQTRALSGGQHPSSTMAAG